MSHQSHRADLVREIRDAEKLIARLTKQLDRLDSDPQENARPCFPYSPRAQEIMAIHNGMSVDALPDAWRWAANAHMAAWMDLLGAAREAGQPHRDEDGRWWTVRRLMGQA